MYTAKVILAATPSRAVYEFWIETQNRKDRIGTMYRVTHQEIVAWLANGTLPHGAFRD